MRMKMYVRILTLVLVLAISVLGLTCIANAEGATESELPSFTAVSEQNDFQFVEVPSDEDAFDIYRREVNRRHGVELEIGTFLYPEEIELLEENGFTFLFPGKVVQQYDTRYGSLSEFNYPVVFEGTNGMELWYTRFDGELIAEAITGKLSNGRSWRNYGNVHHDGIEGKNVLKSCIFYSILYDESTGGISVWEFGRFTREHFVPKDSIYAGHSENEGYIFRNGTDVYAVRDYGCCADRYESVLIAQNVKLVLVTDYEGDGSEGLSQPLFLMTDGTIKCYCRWYLENDVPAHDESNLIDIRFERGFNL